MSETKSSTNDAKRQKTEGDARESRETDDVRVAGYRPLLPPACLVEDLPLSKETQAFIKESRRSVQAILEVQTRTPWYAVCCHARRCRCYGTAASVADENGCCCSWRTLR